MIGVERLSRLTLMIGLPALGLGLLGVLFDPPAFFRAWLTATLFWLGIPLGAMAVFMLHRLTGGRWGEFIEPVLRPAIATLPLVLLLLLPPAFGLEHLFPWTAPAESLSEAVQKKLAYLNPPFFLLRGLGYLVIWGGLGAALLTVSARRLRPLSTVGLILYGLSVTFFGFDWIMSLEPEWYSATFGFLVAGGQLVAALAFCVTASALLRPVVTEAARERLHDLGNLLLGAVMFWAYIAFSQYLIIWSGDLPHGIGWYIHRQGLWNWLILAVVLLHFAAPFVVLLSRRVKRSPRLLGATAAVLLLGHIVHIYWLVLPAFPDDRGFFLYPLTLVLTVGIGGVFLAAFFRRLGANTVLPDPVRTVTDHG